MLFPSAVLGLCLCLSVPLTVVAKQKTDFEIWLTGLRKEALARGISQKTLNEALEGLKPIPKVIELDRNQPELKLDLKAYLSLIVSRSRIERGRRQFRKNSRLLTEVSSGYSVQPRFIVALWGIESDFGRLSGGFPVVGSLATLAYNGRRSAFFKKEFLNALRILDDEHISVSRMEGSWAGAMGQMQFMPSTFQDYAVDFDGDERIDIWNKKGDAFASGANYLSSSGWRSDQTWGREVKLPPDFNRTLIGMKNQKRISKWQALGVRRPDGRDLPTRDLLASIVRPDGAKARAFMVYNNYRVLLKWNRSHNFAIAVGILSDQIRP